MARKSSIEAKIVEYFQTANIEISKAVLEICKSTVKGREPVKAVRRKTTSKPIGNVGTPLLDKVDGLAG